MLFLVDDEAPFAQFATWKFAEYGVVVRTVRSSEAALALIDENPVRGYVGLIDQDLSSSGGAIEGGSLLVAAIRARDDRSRFVLIANTSSAVPGDSAAFRAAGADGYIHKSNFSDFVPFAVQLNKGSRIPRADAQQLMVWYTERIVHD